MEVADTSVIELIDDEHQSSPDDDNVSIHLDDFESIGNLASILKIQYQVILPSLKEGCLSKAMNQSIFHQPARPLILYIHHDRSISRFIFWDTILQTNSIIEYLNANFLIWGWNYTERNAANLIQILQSSVGDEVATTVLSLNVDDYPVMICLTFNGEQIRIECVVHGSMNETEILNLLVNAQDGFDKRLQLPNTTGMTLKKISKEDWSIGQSHLTLVSPDSNEYSSVRDDFTQSKTTLTIISIHRIENPLWLTNYFNEKQNIDERIGYYESERLLFHGCPYDAAERILQEGFDHNRIGRNGSLYGRGFYFSSDRSLSDKYATPDRATGHKRILMCRVLVGRSCQGNRTIVERPANHESTTNSSDIHVVYSNRQVLPEYMITYK